ncbi:MAG: hypothetical protein V4764_02795 [Burkholderia sp.]
MDKRAGSSGVSFATLLFLVFLVLKLTGHIDWSWWWVTAPLWAGVAIFACALAILVIIGGVVALIGK